MPKPVLTLPLMIVLILGLAGLITFDLLKSRITNRTFVVGITTCLVISIASCIPMTMAAISELSNQPVRPEGLEHKGPPHGPPGFRGHPAKPPFRLEDLPPEIAIKHRKLIHLAEEEFRQGRKPDFFLPPDTAHKIRDLLENEHYKEAENLIDDALEKHRHFTGFPE